MTELEVYYPDGKPRPLLIFLVGALGCFPLDFSRALADDLKTGFFSADEERFRLIQQRDEFMPPKQAQKVKGDLIRERFAAFATDQLTSGHDVVADMFFNTPDTRQVPLAVAKKNWSIVYCSLCERNKQNCQEANSSRSRE
ncbi:MAG TPA: AAA family ATPase [Candidatus Saccharimonadales bacterium]